MGKPETKAGVLARETEYYVKYEHLLKRAVSEGRLGGKYPCKLCGMMYYTKQKADDCCKSSTQ